MEGMRGLPKFVLCNLPPKVILWLSDNGPNKLYDAFCVHNCLLWLLQYKDPGIWVQTDKSQITLNYVCMDGNGCWIGWFMNLGYQKEKEQC